MSVEHWTFFHKTIAYGEGRIQLRERKKKKMGQYDSTSSLFKGGKKEWIAEEI